MHKDKACIKNFSYSMETNENDQSNTLKMYTKNTNKN